MTDHDAFISLRKDVNTLQTYVRLMETRKNTIMDWAMIVFWWSIIISMDVGMVALLYKLWMWVL